MNKNLLIYIAMLLLIVIMISCSRLFFRQSYSSENSSSSFRKSIILINDTTLNYSIKVGGIGSATTIRYKIKDSVLIIDSVDTYERNSFQEFTDEVFNHKFKYSKDSLIDLNNNEKYYGQRYIDPSRSKK